MSELEELADHVAFLLDGEIRFAGTQEELKRGTGQPTLERAIAQLMRRGPMALPSAPASEARGVA